LGPCLLTFEVGHFKICNQYSVLAPFFFWLAKPSNGFAHFGIRELQEFNL
jgi:hypothetical protein